MGSHTRKKMICAKLSRRSGGRPFLYH